jgi:hypothetical protein
MQTKLFGKVELPGDGDSIADPEHSTDLNGHVSYCEGGSSGMIEPSQIGPGGEGVSISDGPHSGTRNRVQDSTVIQSGIVSINFSDLVRELSGYDVLSIDFQSEEDIILLKHLSKALTAFVRRTEKSGQRFTANRINDIGKKFESVIVEELRKTPLEAHLLGKPGYPDCMLKQGERISYLEIKTSGSVRKQGMNRTLKAFSFSSAEKIKSDGRHLLLRMQLEEEGSKIWRVIGWELQDISALKTTLRSEFAADFGALAEVRLLASSNKTTRFFTKRETAFFGTSKTKAEGSNTRNSNVVELRGQHMVDY